VDDAAFNAALQMEDEEGNLGTALGRHITTLGP